MVPGVCLRLRPYHSDEQEQGDDKKTGVQGGMPWREKGLELWNGVVRPAIQNDATDPPGTEKNNEPIKSGTTLTRFTRWCGRSGLPAICHVLLIPTANSALSTAS